MDTGCPHAFSPFAVQEEKESEAKVWRSCRVDTENGFPPYCHVFVTELLNV